MNIVVSYLRVSGKGQVDGDGFERQAKSIAAFCPPEKEFRETGVSGTVEGIDRPAFSQALAYLAGARVTYGDKAVYAIVVERMDRLARDLMVSEMLLRECREQGVKIFSADQGNLTDMATNDGDPTRKLIRQLMGALAEWEKSVLVRKLKVSRDRIRSTGKQCEGRKPYGQHAGEHFVMAQILELRHRTEEDQWGMVHPLSYNRIAGILNEMGMRNRSGGAWTAPNIRKILSNHKQPTKD